MSAQSLRVRLENLKRTKSKQAVPTESKIKSPKKMIGRLSGGVDVSILGVISKVSVLFPRTAHIKVSSIRGQWMPPSRPPKQALLIILVLVQLF